MKKNIGPIDRIIRAILGMVLLFLAAFSIGTPWTYLGIIPLATAALQWCPPYAIFKFSTCKRTD